jgi:hypothetical protein
VSRRRLLVTGSQDWDSLEIIRVPLKKVWDADPETLLVSGACPRGSDLLCEMFWREYLGGDIERHPADWYPGGGPYDGMAGIRRSSEMVDLGAWGCVAFGLPCARVGCRGKPADEGWPFHVTHGTKHCSRYAEAKGIPVKRYTPISWLWESCFSFSGPPAGGLSGTGRKASMARCGTSSTGTGGR